MQTFKPCIKYAAVFFTTVIVLTGLLVLAAGIPQDAIKANVLESAQFLCEDELFGTVIEGVEGSMIDRYADSILLGIAYQYDSTQPLESVMLSSYYHTKYQNENKNLLDAVTHGYGSNQQYLRYWHGSNAIIRPLLLILNIQQIYIFNGIVLTVLTIWLLSIFLRKREYLPVLGIAAGLVLTAAWFVPLSLEYTWTYLLMLVISIIGVRLAYAGKRNYMGILFLLGGMVTNYLDFLTTETLTLLVPLLLILWIGKDEPALCAARKAFGAILAWAIGYGCMWGMKWLMAAAVLGENVMPYVAEHIQQRLGGDIGIGLWDYMTGAVLRNVKCLFPVEYGSAGLIAAVALLLAAAYSGYVYHKKQIDKKRILLYLVIGLIPYLRYIVFCNHSYLHCFFTYRAQMATIVAAVMILEELTDWRWLVHANAGKTKS